MYPWESETKSAARILGGLTPTRIHSSDYLHNDWQSIRAALCRRRLHEEELKAKGTNYQQLALVAHKVAQVTEPQKVNEMVLLAMQLTLDLLARPGVSNREVVDVRAMWRRAGFDFTEAALPSENPSLPASVIHSNYGYDLTSELECVALEADGYIWGHVNRVDDRGAICSLWPASEDECYVTISGDEMAIRGIAVDDEFKVTCLKSDDDLMVQFTYVPPRELSEAEIAEIDAKYRDLSSDI